MVLISSKEYQEVLHQQIQGLRGNEFPESLGEELESFLAYYLDIYNPSKTLVLSTSDSFNIRNALAGRDESLNCIINLKRVNDVRWINQLFEATNNQLPNGGVFVGCVETYGLRKQRLMKKFPGVLNRVYYFGDFIFKRVFPKLPVLKKVYFFMTGGRNRALSMAETFGRLYYAGFKIVEHQTIGSNLYFVAQKTKNRKGLKTPTYGPIFKMKRVGKGGKLIEVYKLRSMHAYSEYLQEYVYELNNLQEGGKIKNDFRITTLGKYVRKTFLDELPMLINWLKGDIKLVGVRPISMHYLSLYDQELRMLRRMVKPGLVPPFYVDMPKSLEEIQESEKRYIRAYLENPIKTDLTYLFKAFSNILFKRARSN